jgi:acyl carrier protein
METPVDIGGLAEYLRSRLPEYMVPASYKLVAELPRTKHGKVDRKSLIAGMTDAVAVRTEYVAPRTHLEERLASMWAEVLNVERVGANDNFFDLGGHSLLATRLIARIRGEFGAAVPLRQVFDAPTISGLARLLAEIDEEETIMIRVDV